MAPTWSAALSLVALFFYADGLTYTSGDLEDPDETSCSKVSLLQTELLIRSKAKVSIPSVWFGDFSEAESTFSRDGQDNGKDKPSWSLTSTGLLNPGAAASADPALKSEWHEHPEVLKGNWFHESESGGPHAALQTDYPVLDSSVAGNHAETNPWSQTAEHWIQDYNSMNHISDNFNQQDARGVTADSPVWFDNSLQQIDGFGRTRRNFEGDLSGWKEMSVNTSITCKTPGCTGRSTLKLVDPKKQEFKDCTLNFHVHPTDFDDSREKVSLIKVNGNIAMRDCDPKASLGCRKDVEMPLHPCIRDEPIDKLVDKKGAIVVEGTITHWVDECPYKENLLSAVAVATCLVRDITTTTTTTFFNSAELKCGTSGCTAEAYIGVDPSKGPCELNVTVFQTDFDEGSGKWKEVVEFIEVGGINVTKGAVKPGKNPCKMENMGEKVKPGDRAFAAVKNYKMDKLKGKTGLVKVKAKISEQVDECPHEGNLLHAKVSVVCR